MNSNVGQPKDILKKLTAAGKDALKPSTYYRAAHPELFSDSKKSRKPVLTKAFLEFHLDQLTANKKEQEFEEFCRRLAEKEICSNLVPQTGPTGGGDSKVDSATKTGTFLVQCLKLREVGNTLRTKEERERSQHIAKQLRGMILHVDKFLTSEMDFMFTNHAMTCLGRYGFEERGVGLTPDPVLKFLRERMRHFDLDIPHPPMFGRPPNGWPEV